MKQRRAIASVTVLLVIILLVGVSISASYAKRGTERYIGASEKMALCDLCDALCDLEAGITGENVTAVAHAAGRAEAYLSRSALKGCEGVYEMLDNICENAMSGVYDIQTAKALLSAAQSALEGDGGAELRKLSKSREDNEWRAEEDVREDDGYRMLEKIGRSDEAVALKQAVSFACANAAFEKCESSSAFPPSYKYSGENVFISLTSDGRRVMMYCFDRDAIEGYGISEEDAGQRAERLVFKEKLKLPSNTEQRIALDGNVYRFDYKTDRDGEEIVLVSVEIYSDTGTLRKYDASNYYRYGK